MNSGWLEIGDPSVSILIPLLLTVEVTPPGEKVSDACFLSLFPLVWCFLLLFVSFTLSLLSDEGNLLFDAFLPLDDVVSLI